MNQVLVSLNEIIELDKELGQILSDRELDNSITVEYGRGN